MSMMSSSVCFDNKQDSYCFEFQRIKQMLYKVALGSLRILLSLFTTGLIILLKFYKKYIYHLVMYLRAVNIMQTLSVMIQLFTIKVTDNDCITFKKWYKDCVQLLATWT